MSSEAVAVLEMPSEPAAKARRSNGFCQCALLSFNSRETRDSFRLGLAGLLPSSLVENPLTTASGESPTSNLNF